MSTFNFPYHLVRTDYPENGTRIMLGGGYMFTAPPSGPDLRTFTLSFPTMFYYVTSGGAIDTTTNVTYNMAVLEAFYNSVKLYKSFIYPHPIYGNITVKFKSPLKIPKGRPNGLGSLEDFEIELQEVQQ